ncbi:MAG: hypothetical protein CVV44_06265 [Spirochaetae bacterium HGW-Spirochaetae-1]|nr:MAG: hypothetical protein CVV44_06265 [Spirochaetae bacterium HGW-Spirochaetae-1]
MPEFVQWQFHGLLVNWKKVCREVNLVRVKGGQSLIKRIFCKGNGALTLSGDNFLQGGSDPCYRQVQGR